MTCLPLPPVLALTLAATGAAGALLGVCAVLAPWAATLRPWQRWALLGAWDAACAALVGCGGLALVCRATGG